MLDRDPVLLGTLRLPTWSPPLLRVDALGVGAPARRAAILVGGETGGVRSAAGAARRTVAGAGAPGPVGGAGRRPGALLAGARLAAVQRVATRRAAVLVRGRPVRVRRPATVLGVVLPLPAAGIHPVAALDVVSVEVVVDVDVDVVAAPAAAAARAAHAAPHITPMPNDTKAPPA